MDKKITFILHDYEETAEDRKEVKRILKRLKEQGERNYE